MYHFAHSRFGTQQSQLTMAYAAGKPPSMPIRIESSIRSVTAARVVEGVQPARSDLGWSCVEMTECPASDGLPVSPLRFARSRDAFASCSFPSAGCDD